MQKVFAHAKPYSSLKCPGCGFVFQSNASSIARCKSCYKRFRIEKFVQVEENIGPQINSDEFVEDNTEVVELFRSKTLIPDLSPLSQLPIEITPLDAKFIDPDTVEPILDMLSGTLKKLNINTDDIKEIIVKLNKIAVKRGWVNRFGSAEDNQDEVDIFFKIYELISNSIQNYALKKEVKEMQDTKFENV